MTKDFTPINGDTGIQEPHRHPPPQKAPRRRTRAWERPSVAVELIVLSVIVVFAAPAYGYTPTGPVVTKMVNQGMVVILLFHLVIGIIERLFLLVLILEI